MSTLDPDYEARLQNSRGGAEVAMKIGTVLASVVGGVAAWWLGGTGVLLAAVAGIATAWGLPHLKPAVSQMVAPFWKGDARGAKDETGTNAASLTKSDATPGVLADVREHDTAEVNEARLGSLSPLSGLLPRSKQPGTKPRL